MRLQYNKCQNIIMLQGGRIDCFGCILNQKKVFRDIKEPNPLKNMAAT